MPRPLLPEQLEQHPEEFDQLWDWLLVHWPDTASAVIEIGVRHGGSAACWCQLPHIERVVGVDRIGHDSYKEPEFSQLYQRLEDTYDPFWFVEGSSHLRTVKDEVVSLVRGEQVGLVFLDGDHSAAGVQQDLADYAGLVMDGGFVVLHDIAAPMHGVARVWDGLILGTLISPTGSCQLARAVEFISPRAHGWGGLGVYKVRRGTTDDLLTATLEGR